MFRYPWPDYFSNGFRFSFKDARIISSVSVSQQHGGPALWASAGLPVTAHTAPVFSEAPAERPREAPAGPAVLLDPGPGVTVCPGLSAPLSRSVLTYSILWVSSVGLLWLLFNAYILATKEEKLFNSHYTHTSVTQRNCI